jgi:hypothetical protein
MSDMIGLSDAQKSELPAESEVLEMLSAYPEVMSVEQVGMALGISKNTVRSLLNQHIIPGKKLCHKWIVPRVALCRWLLEEHTI